MKRANSRYLMLLSVGILVMNAGTIINYFIAINDDVIDFFKGFGISLVLASLWLFAKNKNVNNLNQS